MGNDVQLSDCQKMDYLEVFENKTFRGVFFFEIINGDCINNDGSEGSFIEDGSNSFHLLIGSSTR